MSLSICRVITRQLRFVLSVLAFGVMTIQPVWAHGLKHHEFRPIDRRVGMNALVVYSVVQDPQGLIWMGTNQGLYSFDGYSAQYHSSPNQGVAGANGVVYCTSMVDSTYLWLGSENGLLIYNTRTDTYEPTPQGLPNNIRAISRIDGHTFWLGSMNGLFRFDYHTGKIDKVSDSLLPHQAVYSILKLSDNSFYFGTYNGLCRYDSKSERFENIPLGKGEWSANQLILSLLADEAHDRIWIGVEGGLFMCNPSTQTSSEEPLFKGNSIKSLLIDNQNCLWAGTDNGLFIYDPVTGQHRLIRHDALNDRSLVNNIVWSVFADKEQNIWLGTDAGVSLFVYNDKYKTQSISELTGSSEGNQIISLLSDSKGNLWLGGTNGLIKVDKARAKTTWYQQNSKTFPLPHNKVRHIYEDIDGDIWISTDGSICRYNESTSQFVRYQIEDDKHIRNANWAYSICEDETGKMWIATCLGGLFVVDKNRLVASGGKTVVAEKNYYVYGNANALSGTMLQYLAPDADHNMWVGTYRAGINKIDRKNQTVTQFTANSQANPIQSDDVSAMLMGRDNFLWMAMQNSIVRLNTQNNDMKVITDSRLADSYINGMADDGMHLWLSATTGMFVLDKATFKVKQVDIGGDFYSSVFYDYESNKVIVGGINEFVEFLPDRLLADKDQNHVYLTSLKVNDKLVQNGLSTDLPGFLYQSIRFTQAIELPYNFNNLSFSFSELAYNQGQNVHYAYKIEGIDPDWRFSTGGNNHLTYNNLRPGVYALMISRINADGNPMPNPTTLSIEILHPWYSSFWAKLLYSIVFVGLIMVIVNYFMVLNRLRYERLEKVKTLELASHKIEFLTNISHELKTPLSLIIGPLGKIIDQVKTSDVKEQLLYVKQNAQRLNALIHQLMEAGRQQTDGFGLIVSLFDMVEFMKSVVSVFEKPLADKRASVKLVSELPACMVEGDVLKIEAVMNNIMSNAVKFAPEGSQVLVEVRAMPNGVGVSVTDQGPGIPAADLPYIFDRFFQSKDSIRINKEGSGVGLSIVKNYVDLHHGRVQAFSEPNEGTRILVYLPLQQTIQKVEEKPADVAPLSGKASVKSSKPTLLIVEDNHEILAFIANNLSNTFNCITAHNGRLGLDAAIEQHPDVIVTDIMMPVMDGIEMCRKLKENIATASIPVLMLTAKDDKHTEMQSYQYGADGFLAKPFEINYLSERLKQLLHSRKHLVDKARQEAIIKPADILEKSADERFLAAITKVIEEQITDSELNVNLLCDKTGYNAKQVYRRIKALTGQTAVDYIRSVRLKKAAVLLSRKTFTVAEVMYMVGFSNHSYFAKRFQEMYGKSPKQYMEDVE